MNRILVVDDSLSVRKVLERLLAVHADVTVAVSAEDALAQLDAGLPLPDLLISDVLMPGMSGLDLTRTLRARPETAGLPVVLISGILDDQLLLEAEQAGVRSVVRKPFTAEALLPVIAQALRGESGMGRMGNAAGTASPVLPPLLSVSPVPPSPTPLVSAPPTPAVPHTAVPAALSVLERARPPLSPVATAPVPAAPVSAAPVSAAPVASPVGAVAPVQPESVALHDELLATVLRKPGVLGVMVTTSGGEPLGFDGTLDLPAEDLAMYARFLANTASVLGGRLGMPEQRGLQIDFSPRTLLILPLGQLLLVCLLADPNSGSMVRFTLRRYLEA